MKCFTFVITGLFTVALLVGSVGCGGEKKTAEGPEGKKLSVTAPKDQTIKQGGSADFKIEITREKFTDPVDVKFTDLPTGVTIVQEGKDLTLAKDVNSGTFTLKAADDAKLVEGHKVTATASSGSMKQDVHFKVTVQKKKD